MKKIFILTVFIGLIACDDYLDVNEDPNNPTDAPSRLVLPSAQLSIAGVVGGSYHLVGSIWAQFYTQSNVTNAYTDIDNYNIQSTFLGQEYEELYAGALNDLQFIIDKAVVEEDWATNLIATVLRAYTMQILSDLYDKVAFTDALKGDESAFTPSFEDGSVVYAALINEIDNALAKDFTASSSVGPGDFDLIYGGDVAKWRGFANSLKLKILMREALIPGSLAPGRIASLLNSGETFLLDHAAIVSWVDREGKSNPLYEIEVRKSETPNNLKASATLVNFMESTGNGQRLNQLFDLSSSDAQISGQHQGTNNLSTTQLAPETVSNITLRAVDNMFFMSIPEALFLRAEAAARGFSSENAITLYNSAVRSSYNLLVTTLPNNQVPNEIAYPNGTMQENLNAILTQKWVAQARINGIEAWFDILRTGIPGWSPVPTSDPGYDPSSTNASGKPQILSWPSAAVTSEDLGQYPKRLLYPDRELNRNPNAPEQPENGIFSRVWWDVED